MIRIGITGQAGFIGTHLYNLLGTKENIQRIPFKDDFFDNDKDLRNFVGKCDVIVHLAAMNRHTDPKVIYDTNISLVQQLILAMEHEGVSPYILFSSSIQEEQNNLYGKSKQKGRKMFEEWAQKNNASFTGLVIPNVFGPFGKPFYNSFIATFCYQLNNNQQAKIDVDNTVKLIYVGSLTKYIINKIENRRDNIVEKEFVPFDFEDKVSNILKKLNHYKDLYINKGIIPQLYDRNDINLFNTLASYMNIKNRYPYSLIQNSDDRGAFVEIIKLSIGGQVSFSTTKPKITRGDHYHTRKIERFTVIKGKALIELRRIGTEEVLKFYLDGEEPSYVDMPIWYTHNITNIGDDDLYTIFWINEWYDPDDADTFFEKV